MANPARLPLVAPLLVAALVLALAPARARATGVCYLAIDNVRMGVDQGGQLNAPYVGTDPLGIGKLGFRYDTASGAISSTERGAPNEGWAVSAELSNGTLAKVWFNNKNGPSDANFMRPAPSYTTAPGPDNTTCNSVSDMGVYTVAHDFGPSGVTDVFRINVTITNTDSAPLYNITYRRLMDWDIDPAVGTQRYQNYLTINWFNSQPAALVSWGNSRNSVMDPLVAPLGSTNNPRVNVAFTKVGAEDQAATLTFNFGTLAPGAAKTFTLYYGVGANDAEAQQRLAASGAEVYSLAYPAGSSSGPILDNGPAVFFFGFAGVGGVPADVDECAAPTNPCGSNTVCTNVVGGPNSYTCACLAGFTSPTSDGRNCVAPPAPPPGPNPPGPNPPGPNPPPPGPPGALTSPGDYTATAYADAQLDVRAPGVLTGVTGGDGQYAAALAPRAATSGTIDAVSRDGGFLYTPAVPAGKANQAGASTSTEASFEVDITDGAGGAIHRNVLITIVATPAPLPAIEVNTFDLRPRKATSANKAVLRGVKCGSTPVKADTTVTAGALKLLAGGEIGAPGGIEFKLGRPPGSRAVAPSAAAARPGKVGADGTCLVRLPAIKLGARQSATKQSANCYHCMKCLKALDMAWGDDMVVYVRARASRVGGVKRAAGEWSQPFTTTV